MRRLFLALGLSSSVVWAAPAPKSVVLTPDKARTVYVQGVVDWGILDEANRLIELATTSTDAIFIQINSPGGMVFAGTAFISAMETAQARGIVLKCYVTVAAASMAFNILNACDERYAFRNAQLLFHTARVQMRGVVTESTARSIALELGDINTAIKDELQATMKMDPVTFDQAFLTDKWWTTNELQSKVAPGWITIIKGVLGNAVDLFLSPGAKRPSAKKVSEDPTPKTPSDKRPRPIFYSQREV